MALAEDLDKLKGDSNLVSGMLARMAQRIVDHEHLMNKLSTVPPEWKQIAYDVMKPNLKFKPWPLDRYVAAAAQRASADHLPTIQEWDRATLAAGEKAQSEATEGTLREEFAGSGAVYMPDAIADAQEAIDRSQAKRILTVICHKCLGEGQFLQIGNETKLDAILKARKAGWIYDVLADREICPKCPTSLRMVQ